MAGESPDRSKQRESSAGATSGNADSVPEARDPRLAVARSGSGGSTGAGAGGGQKDSSDGGADTATKVFRTPAVEEDTALRNAVSSWVRDADDPEASTDAPAKDAEDTEGGTGAKEATGAISDGAGSEAADTGAADAGSGADAKADAEGNGAEADAGSGAKGDGAKAGAGSVKAGADDGDGSAKADAKGEKAPADAEAVTDAAEGPEPGADAEDGSDTKAGAEEKASAGDAAAAAAARAKTAAETADAEAEALADDAAAKAGTGAKADAGAKTASGTETGARPKSPAGADIAGAKADAEAEGDADAKDDTAADAKADADPKSDGEDEAEARPEAGAEEKGAEGGGEARKTGDGAADADGAEDPQGPPAADDESRTGGAGAKTAGGEAEGKGKTGGADAVDQPTAIFKAVRPKDQVDQPTTMLKVGKGAKQDEPESERTSKFVALKDDVRHKPAATPADETTAVPQIGPERTTQQPLPPKPPLDLLAELTNTPPPPETPVRTALRRVKIWTPLVLLLVIIFAVVQTLRPLPSPTLALTAKDSYTFDGGRVNLPWPSEGQGWMDGDGIGTMGNFGKQTPVAIGSVAKTMTAYIILRDHPLKPGQEGPKIKVDATAEKEGGYNKSGESTLNTVHAGDSLTEKQALSAVMIPSANNIARLLARWDAGSEAAFVQKMNATAKQLGMTGTTYTDPSGLKETTVSTAQDQVKLGRAVVKIPALVAITSAASWTDPTGQNWPNYNSLPYWIGAIGIKTGTTTAAGGNLLFAARKKVGGQTVTVVGAILGQHKPSILDTVNEVSKTALLGAEHALTSAKILKKGDVVGYVDDQLGGQTPIVVTQDVTAVGWSGLKVKLSFAAGTVPHTAKAGTQVGTLTVGDGSTAGVKVPVALQQDLAEPGFGAKLTRIG
ncbi:D-alanyl-D-alanine carboxypeptidase [Streptomyces sp. DconLS]|uniref:D-alanyl-D-alanine carboxypeptidase n=1 Tax=Streptomyces sp. LamerLS-31b TaxID=1839765 RepID=UPI00081DE3B4|nr:D-alanyl-D-alanine carboxypeptidase [Streptomyces sp. LamerLS-31b]SCF81552.1 D-alanyl-D-alanine carboxypeptidase [Streptomyces sp. DconLS]SCG04292.1 D-alanyl-D-alanine carboxypeptidase [Streptomyces sp. LamerLS-31b]